MFGKLSQSWSFLSLGVFSPRNHLLHLAVIDLKNHSECGNKETYCKTCTWKKLFSSVSRMVLSCLNLMENNTVRYQRELNWTQSMTHSQTSSAKCVKILWRNIILNINLRKLGIFDSFPWLQTYLLIQMKTKDFKRRSTTVTSLHVKNSTLLVDAKTISRHFCKTWKIHSVERLWKPPSPVFRNTVYVWTGVWESGYNDSVKKTLRISNKAIRSTNKASPTFRTQTVCLVWRR